MVRIYDASFNPTHHSTFRRIIQPDASSDFPTHGSHLPRSDFPSQCLAVPLPVHHRSKPLLCSVLSPRRVSLIGLCTSFGRAEPPRLLVTHMLTCSDAFHQYIRPPTLYLVPQLENQQSQPPSCFVYPSLPSIGAKPDPRRSCASRLVSTTFPEFLSFRVSEFSEFRTPTFNIDPRLWSTRHEA